MPVVEIEVPDQLLEQIEALAARDGVSIAAIVESIVAEKLLALARMECLDERGVRGSREKLQRILDRVPHVPPDPGDEL